MAATASTTRHPPPIAVALGSGAARGWGHIGVLQALEETGVRPDIVCGTSIGALVGGIYLAGNLTPLEQWIRDLTWSGFLRLFDVHLSGGGFLEGARFLDAVRCWMPGMSIEELHRPFAAVATDFDTGGEVWLQHGSLFSAVRASIAVPGLFTPVWRDGRLLVDGGLVNPVPVSVCRALGAERVIAVNLNGDLVGRHSARRQGRPASRADRDAEQALLARLSEQVSAGLKELPGAGTVFGRHDEQRHDQPGLFEVVAGSLNIMQDRITRSRMAGDPPDLVLTPRVSHIGLLEFTRAGEAIAEGRRCVESMRAALQALASDQ